MTGLKIELGCGKHPTLGYVHHDRNQHSEEVDVVHDLEKFPWPWGDNSVEELLAIDVFEHLLKPVHDWLDECWRILEPGGTLIMRLPSFNHPMGYGYRDITHVRVFHPESFYYFCPDAPGSLFKDFGAYYWGDRADHWWSWGSCMIDQGDFRYVMHKKLYTPSELERIKRF